MYSGAAGHMLARVELLVRAGGELHVSTQRRCAVHMFSAKLCDQQLQHLSHTKALRSYTVVSFVPELREPHVRQKSYCSNAATRCRPAVSCRVRHPTPTPRVIKTGSRAVVYEYVRAQVFVRATAAVRCNARFVRSLQVDETALSPSSRLAGGLQSCAA